MGNFIPEYSFSRFFHSGDTFSILNVGYDDFSFVKPILNFRTQNFYTIHFVLSGEGTLDINNSSYKVSKGEMFFIPPNSPMRYYPNDNNPWEYVWFAFKGEDSARYGEAMGFSNNIPVIKQKQSHKIKYSLERLFEQLKKQTIGYYGILSCFYEIIEFSVSGEQDNDITKIKEIIDSNFTIQDFSIEKLCKEVNFSHAHLLRLFKKEYGITISKYLIKKRINFAANLLKNSYLSVSSVAFSSGFSDEIHFMKTFKKEMGVTALTYRNKM